MCWLSYLNFIRSCQSKKDYRTEKLQTRNPLIQWIYTSSQDNIPQTDNGKEYLKSFCSVLFQTHLSLSNLASFCTSFKQKASNGFQNKIIHFVPGIILNKKEAFSLTNKLVNWIVIRELSVKLFKKKKQEA